VKTIAVPDSLTAGIELVKVTLGCNRASWGGIEPAMRRAARLLGGFVVLSCGVEGVQESADGSTSADESEGSASAEADSSGSASAPGPASSSESESGSESESSSAGSTSGDAEPDVPPTGSAALRPWLEAGEYLDWTAESAPHASTGPHFGTVRTFVNGPLLDSLTAAGDPHPLDAAAVKELYGGGTEVVGWSVMVKVADGTGGGTWYWLEYYAGSTYADGVGDSLCTGCHGAGTDHVLTPFPLQ
jgi:hypothetical protein